MLGVLLLWLAGCRGQAEQAGSRSVLGKCHQTVVALCEDYPEETRSLDGARRDFETMRRAVVTVLRVAIGWDGVEGEKGEHDWQFWDDFFRLAGEYQVELIPYVCCTPQWAASDPGEDHWKSPPKDNANFARFMGEIARRYSGKVRSWELWNEPDNPQY